MKDITVPLQLISILADGEFHSGEQLGTAMGMSRAAINKHIQTVRDWGVDIFTVLGKVTAFRIRSSCLMKLKFSRCSHLERLAFCLSLIQRTSI